MICNSIENVSHIFAISGDILLPQVATNGNYLLYDRSCHKWLHTIAKNGNKRNDLQLYGELKSLFLPFLAIFCFPKLPQMATTCFVTATTCFMTEVAKNGNKWLHIIAN